MAKTIIGRITEYLSQFSDTVTTTVRRVTRRFVSSYRPPTNDWARSDYDFWRRAYYGRARGLEISGLLVRPLVSKVAAWSLGRAPRWKLESEASQEALTDWWNKNHPDILKCWRGALKLGDGFIVINSDLSVTLLRPDCVDPIVAEDDYSMIIGWRVTQTMQHPETTKRMVTVDEYYIDRRVHRVEVDGLTTQTQTYPNLLGMLPIVAIPNQADDGETFGHAEAEALLSLLHRYGEVIDAAIEGNVLQGRPTPVLLFETVDDLDKFDEENATFETQTLPNGTSQRVKLYDVDLSQLLVASGATFSYAAPGQFTGDTAKLLEIMFYLLLEHSELPEFVFGNAISSSKASAETQLPVFIEFIKMRRGEMVGWLTAIAQIAMAYLSLITPGVAAETPTLQWEALDQEDGKLTLETITWALTEGLIDRRTALMLAPVEVEDLDSVLDKAEEEKQERDAAAAEQATNANGGQDQTKAMIDAAKRMLANGSE